jgi:hypothetical protein
MAFVPEGQHYRSQARSAFAPKGLEDWRTQPRVSTLGNLQINGSP